MITYISPNPDIKFAIESLHDSRRGPWAEGTLVSPLLDLSMFPNGRAIVAFEHGVAPFVTFDPEPFQIESVNTFLQIQQAIRVSIESSLKGIRRDNPPPSRDQYQYWDKVTIKFIEFWKKAVPTADKIEGWRTFLKSPKKSKALFEYSMRFADKPETRTTFTIYMDCSVEDEHRNWTAKFTDGVPLYCGPQ